ncbi:MAG TPA: MBL fold metallo-hydrolase [Gemmatimonadales bacterium]|nr:MBL fold metallo-hydrolase [Gemmatimonadales bacterium]
MRLTFLGTGTSFGVPQIGCSCAVCTSSDPRDRRYRSGALVETGTAAILIDTPPELRLQLIAARPARVDAVVYTHEHADHTNGIDDLRMFSVRQRAPLPVYGPAETLECLRTGFGYIFDDAVRPYEGTSKPRLELRPLEAGREVEIAGVPVLPLAFEHGHVRVFGYRFGRELAYITDVKAVGEPARRHLRGLKVLVLNALWWRPHPTHMSIHEAIETARHLGAERTYLTHLTHETSHAELEAALPSGILPAYDGLVVEV